MLNSIPAAPEQLIQMLTAPNPAAANTNALPGQFMAPGSRNNDLISLAGYLRGRRGMFQAQISAALLAAKKESSHPLAEDEVPSRLGSFAAVCDNAGYAQEASAAKLRTVFALRNLTAQSGHPL